MSGVAEVRRTERCRSRWRLSLGTCLGILSVLPLTADAKPAVTTHEYSGHLIGDPNFRSISLEVRERGGANVQARFSVEDLELICDGGFRHRTFGPDRFEFVATTVFHSQRYKRLRDGNWSYYEVKGRLLPNGHAKGYVYYLQDSYGAAEAAGPECSTGGQLYFHWRAKEAGG